MRLPVLPTEFYIASFGFILVCALAGGLLQLQSRGLWGFFVGSRIGAFVGLAIFGVVLYILGRAQSRR